MSATNLILSSRLPSLDAVKRFPSLRRVSAMRQEIIQDVFLDLSAGVEQGDHEELTGADPQVKQSALELYNTVVADGRFTSLLASDPKKAAELAGLEVSDEAADLVRKAATAAVPGGEVQNPEIAVVAIAVAVTVVTKGSDPIEQIIIDQSGQVKL